MSTTPTLHKTSPFVLTNVVHPYRTSILFTLLDSVGALDKVLHVFKSHSISLTRIESRPNRLMDGTYDFFVDFNAESPDQVVKVEAALSAVVNKVIVIGSGVGGFATKDKTPWFPRQMRDLDGFAEKVLEMGEELSSDHPGAMDAEYRARRAEITRIARQYRTGMPIPRIEYSQKELDTWKICYKELVRLYPTHACREHNYVFPLLQQNCGYSEDNIPQLEDISRFLRDCTGFTLRPVMGLLTARDFLNGLAFRVFHSTQYIRHHSKPLYTPEPDICHELLGHVPLFADPDFASFSQEIGLASLGASDEELNQLASIYWFTVEFGLCKQVNEKGESEVKAFGAGLLSSFGELEYSVHSDVPERRPFTPESAGVQSYPITVYQPIYYVAESFRDATQKIRDYVKKLKRPFTVHYNAYTQSVEVLDSKESIGKYARTLQGQLNTLVDALERVDLK